MENLENRFNGQGHRAALRRNIQSNGDRSEAMQARVGEERQMYLQERGPAHRNNVSKLRKQAEFAALLGSNAPSTPLTHRGHQGRGRVAPNRPTNHARAPSPRASGTIRFVPGGQMIGGAVASQRAVSNQQPPLAASNAPALNNPGVRAAAAVRAVAAMRAATSNAPTQQPTPSTVPVQETSIPVAASVVTSNTVRVVMCNSFSASKAMIWILNTVHDFMPRL